MPKFYMPVLTLVEQAAQDGLNEVARATLARAKELVPEDTGRLRRSGRVQIHHLAAAVKFTAPHAWLIHERADFRHEKGQAKYLEAAVDEADIVDPIYGRVKDALGG